MDSDTNQTVGARDLTQIYNYSGIVISVDRVNDLIRKFVDHAGGEMNVHGYLRFMASAYAQKYDCDD